MTARDKAIERARKLSLLARDQAGTPEGDTAARMLANLTERWHLTDAEVNPPQEEQDPAVVRTVIDLGEPRLRARAILLSVLGHIGGALVTFRDEGSFVGRVYGDTAERTERIVETFGEVEAYLDRHVRLDIVWQVAEGRKKNAKRPEKYDQVQAEVRRDWWYTAAAVLLRLWTPPPAAPPTPITAKAQPRAQADPASKAPAAAPVTALAVAVPLDVKEATARIAEAAQEAPAETWRYSDGAAAAISRLQRPGWVV